MKKSHTWVIIGIIAIAVLIIGFKDFGGSAPSAAATGEEIKGVISIEALAEKSGCAVPKGTDYEPLARCLDKKGWCFTVHFGVRIATIKKNYSETRQSICRMLSARPRIVGRCKSVKTLGSPHIPRGVSLLTRTPILPIDIYKPHPTSSFKYHLGQYRLVV